MSVDHYENFPVASILCPKKLRPAVASLYWFARTADDLADEGDATPEQRLIDLAAYRADLTRVLAGKPPSPRWPSLFEVMTKHSFLSHHLYELLDAFERDVQGTATGYRYQTKDDLLAYCKLSANPIGRLMLHLYGVTDDDSKAQSDAICTALQLINFWQDVSVDVPRGRYYVLPEYADSLEAACDWARQLMLSGSPLCKRLGGRFGFELRLVVQGGMCILEKIKAQGFDTSTNRPKITKRDAPRILYRALLM